MKSYVGIGTRKSGDEELRDRWARAGAISGAGVLAERLYCLICPRPFFAQLGRRHDQAAGAIGNREAKKLCGRGQQPS